MRHWFPCQWVWGCGTMAAMNEVTQLLMALEDMPYQDWHALNRLILRDWCDDNGQGALGRWLEEQCMPLNGYIPTNVTPGGRILCLRIARCDGHSDVTEYFRIGREIGRGMQPIMENAIAPGCAYTWEAPHSGYIERWDEPIWVGSDRVFFAGPIIGITWVPVHKQTRKRLKWGWHEQAQVGRNVIERSRRWNVWKRFWDAGLVHGVLVGNDDPAWTVRHKMDLR